MIKKSFLSLGCALIALSFNATAGLIYDESVSGDSAPWYNNGGEALGPVSSGDYVLGTMSDTGDGTFSYWDGYNFYLDGSISNIYVEAISAPVNNNWQLYTGVGWGTERDSGLLLRFGDYDFGTLVNFDVTDWIPGYYTLGNNSVVASWTYNYKISFGGANVPEPASFALLGLGLAGLVSMRRKQTVA